MKINGVFADMTGKADGDKEGVSISLEERRGRGKGSGGCCFWL